jgi:ComF family protein
MSFLDWVFPKACFGCGLAGAYVCSSCVNLFKIINEPVCPVCHQKSRGGAAHPRCRKPYSLDGLVSIFAYQGICKRVIGKLKYRLVTQAFPDMIEVVISLGDLSQFASDEWLLVPVPLHASRQRWRGFNQADYIAQALGNYLKLETETNLLTRHKRTKPQMSLHARQRSENIKDAFSLNQNYSKSAIEAAKSKKIVLVDDVYTTGATMKEAAKTLKRNGFGVTWALTLARTLNPGE